MRSSLGLATLPPKPHAVIFLKTRKKKVQQVEIPCASVTLHCDNKMSENFAFLDGEESLSCAMRWLKQVNQNLRNLHCLIFIHLYYLYTLMKAECNYSTRSL